MADNTELNAGSGGDVIATDDIAGVKYQRVKVTYGVDGSATDVSDSNPMPVDDAGGSLTVDNAALSVTGGGVEATALRVTIASDSTGVVSVDDNGGSLTVDGTVAATQSGSWTVDLGATDNAVLDSIDTNTTALAAALKAEDAAHVTGDVGIQALAVRNDSDASLAGTTGDYTPLQVDSSGYLKVNIKAGAGSGGTASTDDAAFTAASGSGTPIMGFVTADTVDSGDVGVVGMDANRNLKISIEADNVGIGGGTEYTAGTDTYSEATTKVKMAGAVRNDVLASLANTDNELAPLQVDANGGLYATLSGIQSSGNTSTTPLGSGATYTGTGELNQYPDVMISCQTDNTGTLYFDFSVDGSNWSTFPVSGFSVASGVHEFHTALKGGRYFRVRLVNDAGAQSYLRLYTYYGHFSKLPNAPLNQTIGSDSDSVLTTAVIAADNGSNYVNVGATTNGNLKISVQEISDGLDVGAGNAGTETLRVSVSTDDVNLSAIKTAVETIDNAIAGSEMQVDVVTQPALAATTDNVGAALMTNVIHNGTTALTPKFAVIDAASSGDNTLVAAVAGKKIRVLQAFLVATSDVNVRFESGASGTALTGQMDLTANSGFTLPFSPVGWFEAGTNTLLNLELSGAVSVDGCLVYVEV